MANPFVNLLGQMSMLGRPQQQPMFNMPSPRVQMPPISAPQQSMPELQMYEPQYNMQNRFASLLDNMPQPNNPGILTRIGASLSGLGKDDSYGAAQNIAYAPYFNELNQFKMRAPLMQQAADNERQMNQVGLQSNNQNRQFMINERKNDIAQNKIESTERTAQEKNEIARIRANAYDFKSRNPNLDIQAPPGGFLIGINPQTGQAMPILDDQGQKIPSGKLSDEDRIILTGKQQQIVEGIRQTGANNRTANTIAGANARDANNWQVLQDKDGNSYRYNPTTNEVEPITGLPTGPLTKPSAPRSASTTTPTPASLKTQRTLRAQEIINARPDLAPYIGKDGTVAPPKQQSSVFGMKFGSSFDENVRKQIVDYIEGRSTVIPQSGMSTSPIANTPGMPPIPAGSKVESRTSGTAPTGKVLVIAPNGQEGYIPASQVDAALAQGYKRK